MPKIFILFILQNMLISCQYYPVLPMLSNLRYYTDGLRLSNFNDCTVRTCKSSRKLLSQSPPEEVTGAATIPTRFVKYCATVCATFAKIEAAKSECVCTLLPCLGRGWERIRLVPNRPPIDSIPPDQVRLIQVSSGLRYLPLRASKTKAFNPAGRRSTLARSVNSRYTRRLGYSRGGAGRVLVCIVR